MPRPMSISVDVAEHDRSGCPDAKTMCRLDHLKPLRGIDLIGANDGADLIVQDLGSGTRQRSETRFLQAREKCAYGDSKCRCALPDFQRRERMNMHPRTDFFDCAANRKVGRTF